VSCGIHDIKEPIKRSKTQVFSLSGPWHLRTYCTIYNTIQYLYIYMHIMCIYIFIYIYAYCTILNTIKHDDRDDPMFCQGICFKYVSFIPLVVIYTHTLTTSCHSSVERLIYRSLLQKRPVKEPIWVSKEPIWVSQCDRDIPWKVIHIRHLYESTTRVNVSCQKYVCFISLPRAAATMTVTATSPRYTHTHARHTHTTGVEVGFSNCNRAELPQKEGGGVETKG